MFIHTGYYAESSGEKARRRGGGRGRGNTEIWGLHMNATTHAQHHMGMQTASKQRRGVDWGNKKYGQKKEKKMFISDGCHHTSTHDVMIRAAHKRGGGKKELKKKIEQKKMPAGGC